VARLNQQPCSDDGEHEENATMKRIRFSIVFLLILLVAGAAGAVAITVAQGQPRLLLRAGDLKKWGTEYVSAPEGPCLPRSGPGNVTGWTEGRCMGLVVVSPADKTRGGMVGSEAYHFPSATDARLAVERLQDPGTAFGFQTLAEGQALIDADVLKLLKAHSGAWRAWYGLDREGLPGYLLRLQTGSDVAELQLSVPTEKDGYGRLLLNDAARALLRPGLLEFLGRLRRK
jgi:hypothetical protein